MGGKYGRYVLGATTLGVTYFITARIGLSHGAVSGFATLIWAPSGIALAAILLYGYRIWPGIIIAAFLVNLSIGASPLVALGISVGNTLEPLLGACLLSRLIGFDNSFWKIKDVLGLIFLAAFISTLVSPAIGVQSLYLGGEISRAAYQSTWLAWWAGDMLGIILVTPFILVWARRPRMDVAARRTLELVLVTFFLVLMSAAIFSGMLTDSFGGLESDTYKYLLFPVLVWIALHYGQRASISANLIIAIVAIWCTVIISSGHTDAYLTQALSSVQRFIGFNSITYMVFSTILAEREFAQRKQRKLFNETVQLDKQAKYLERLNKAKDEFIQLASHQLRTPTSVVKMYLGMLLEKRFGKLTKKQIEGIEVAYRSNERQIQLIDELLGVAQIDMGDIVLNIEEVDMRFLITNVIEEFASTIAEREQTITFVHGSEKYMVKVDQSKMMIVIENLIDNASKYSPSGKNIEVNLAIDENGLKIDVKDKGVGIAKKDIGKLFDKFSRIHNTLSIARGGSGLGLYWVKNIVELHGGTINVTSKLGHGSTFTIRL